MLLAQTNTGAGGASLILPILLFGAVVYFFMIRPQRNRVRQQHAVASQLEIGDQIRTVGGIFGVVIGLEPDSVILGVEEGRIRVARAAVQSRIEPETEDIADPLDGEN